MCLVPACTRSLLALFCLASAVAAAAPAVGGSDGAGEQAAPRRSDAGAAADGWTAMRRGRRMGGPTVAGRSPVAGRIRRCGVMVTDHVAGYTALRRAAIVGRNSGSGTDRARRPVPCCQKRITLGPTGCVRTCDRASAYRADGWTSAGCLRRIRHSRRMLMHSRERPGLRVHTGAAAGTDDVIGDHVFRSPALMMQRDRVSSRWSPILL